MLAFFREFWVEGQCTRDNSHIQPRHGIKYKVIQVTYLNMVNMEISVPPFKHEEMSTLYRQMLGGK
jgi:hypothetical protein